MPHCPVPEDTTWPCWFVIMDVTANSTLGRELTRVISVSTVTTSPTTTGRWKRTS
jgi:hypothetical protein